jgi:hypothetical protein
MTFDPRFCEGIFDTLSRNDMLHAYRVYLWRRTLGLVYHPPLEEEASLRPLIKDDPFPPGNRLNGFDAERALRM